MNFTVLNGENRLLYQYHIHIIIVQFKSSSIKRHPYEVKFLNKKNSILNTILYNHSHKLKNKINYTRYYEVFSHVLKETDSVSYILMLYLNIIKGKRIRNIMYKLK